MLLYYQVLLFVYFVITSLIKNKTIPLILALIFCFWLVGYRELGLGKDDWDYLDFFVRNQHYNSIVSVFSGEFEPLFSLYTAFFIKILPPHQMFPFITFTTLTLTFFAYKLIDRDNFFYFIFYYLVTALYWLGFHHIRFGIAFPFCILAIKYFESSKPKFLLVYIIAILFHYSAILLLPIFFFKKINKKKWFVGIILGAYFLWSIDFFKLFVGLMVDINVLPIRTLDLVYSEHVFSQSPFQLGTIKMVIISLLGVYFNSNNDKYYIYIKAYAIITALTISMASMAIFSNRVAAINMGLEPIVIFSIFFSIFKFDKVSKVIYYIIPCIYGFYLIYYVDVLEGKI